MKLCHDPAMTVRTTDHIFMVSGRSFFADDIDFGITWRISGKQKTLRALTLTALILDSSDLKELSINISD